MNLASLFLSVDSQRLINDYVIDWNFIEHDSPSSQKKRLTPQFCDSLFHFPHSKQSCGQHANQWRCLSGCLYQYLVNCLANAKCIKHRAETSCQLIDWLNSYLVLFLFHVKQHFVTSAKQWLMWLRSTWCVCHINATFVLLHTPLCTLIFLFIGILALIW